MELILHGWIDRDTDDNIRINEGNCLDSLSERIMNHFDYECLDDDDLGGRRAVIQNVNLRMWFSDRECTLEEAQMNFECFIETGELLTEGYFIGYSEWTISGFVVDKLLIGGHDLDMELNDHIGQYAHLILSD